MEELKNGRSTDTRRRILQAAEQLYYEGGYEHISFQVMADQLQMSKPALFYHFRTKQDLFFALLLYILEHFQRILADVTQQVHSSVQERLTHIMRQLAQESSFDMMRFMREEYHLLKVEQQQEVREAWQVSLLKPVQQILDAGIASGELRRHDSHVSAYMFLHTYLLLPRPKSSPERQLELTNDEDIVHALLDLYMHGISSSSK